MPVVVTPTSARISASSSDSQVASSIRPDRSAATAPLNRPRTPPRRLRYVGGAPGVSGSATGGAAGAPSAGATSGSATGADDRGACGGGRGGALGGALVVVPPARRRER